MNFPRTKRSVVITKCSSLNPLVVFPLKVLPLLEFLKSLVLLPGLKPKVLSLTRGELGKIVRTCLTHSDFGETIFGVWKDAFFRKILLDVVGTSGYGYGVLRSFSMERIEQGNERTAHSRFKLPRDLTGESLCNIKKNTQMGNLLDETNIIVWDESPMNDRRWFETLDRSLRDIFDMPDKLFGGKSIVMGGDFRQTLLVKKGASKPEIIAASIAELELWPHFRVCKLKENMRLLQPAINEEEQRLLRSFAKWILDIGDGKYGEPDSAGINNSLQTLQRPNAHELQQIAIICPRNDTADAINSTILAAVKAESTDYKSLDEADPLRNDRGEVELLYSMEYLNTLPILGFPPHELEHKVGAPIMTLRSVNLQGGLCIGTRMTVKKLWSKLIEAQVIIGNEVGEKVYIPRIILTNKDPHLSFISKRK
ncbi:DNA helicase [Tanacetum coccineum]